MIEILVWRWTKSMIDDAIVDPDGVDADVGLDPPHEMEVFAKNRRLLHQTLGPENAAVRAPDLAVADEAGRDRADPSMQRMTHRTPSRVIVVVGWNLARSENVIETASDEESRKRSCPGEPFLSPSSSFTIWPRANTTTRSHSPASSIPSDDDTTIATPL